MGLLVVYAWRSWLMGKVFLVLIGVGLVWSGYALVKTWRKQFGGDKPAAERPAADPAEGDRVPRRGRAAAESRVAEADREPVVGQPLVLRVQAWCDEWLRVESWGRVSVGDVLPDGSVLLSWSKCGGDWFAVVQKGADLVRARFERQAESALRRAEYADRATAKTPQTSDVPVFAQGEVLR